MLNTAVNHPHKTIKVLIVDDSALIRKLLTHVLSGSPDIEVVAAAVDAYDAREKIKLYNPDVVTLDIEMPGMDGLSFLEKVMKLRPTPVVMCSTLTKKGATETLRALELGAVDFVPKPVSNVKEQLEAYADELIEKVCTASKVKFNSVTPVSRQSEVSVLSPTRKRRYNRLVAIGSSTGGTVALEEILKRLPKDSPPMVIAQHIPVGFSAAFAKRVNEYTEVHVKEAEDGDEIKPGYVYLAPGNFHLCVTNIRGKLFCRLDDGEPVLRHKPSVDVLFNSVCKYVGTEAIGIILTGMGKDGAAGIKAMHDMGMNTIAQDEKTSMVWGMPKQAIDLGGIKYVAGLNDIASLILEHAY